MRVGQHIADGRDIQPQLVTRCRGQRLEEQVAERHVVAIQLAVGGDQRQGGMPVGQ